MILVFDTETTGLPKSWKAPASDVNNWPRIIQLAWAVFSEDGELLASRCDLIRPDGWEIPKEEFWINHGYSTDRSLVLGIPIEHALKYFSAAYNQCAALVAHNIDFDKNVLGAELIRRIMINPTEADKFAMEKKIPKICTMKPSTDLCQLPGPYGFKWPTLEELHRHLFRTEFEGAHDAMNDVMACAKCFFALAELKIIKTK